MKLRLRGHLTPLCLLSGLIALSIFLYGEWLLAIEFFFGFLILMLAVAGLSRLDRER